MKQRKKKKRYNFKNYAQVNRSHKDRLFRLVFREKEDILQLYNAVNGTDYQDADALEVNTMEGAVYLGMKNDLSFLIEDTLNLYEHQSTYSLNLPVRGLLYLADIYRGFVETRGLDLYKNAREPLPLPKYLVFYNGKTDEPDSTKLKLSDAFIRSAKGEEGCLECTATLLNINQGHNKRLMENCKQLREYAQFVALIRQYTDTGMTLKQAVDRGIDECIELGILTEILKKNRAEVTEVVLTEYNEKLHLKNVWEEGKLEGKLEGMLEGKSEAIIDLLQDYGSVPEKLAEQIYQQSDLMVLKKWLKYAAKVESVEDFIIKLNENKLLTSSKFYT